MIGHSWVWTVERAWQSSRAQVVLTLTVGSERDG